MSAASPLKFRMEPADIVTQLSCGLPANVAIELLSSRPSMLTLGSLDVDVKSSVLLYALTQLSPKPVAEPMVTVAPLTVVVPE